MLSPDQLARKFDDHFNRFYDLMPNKVREILLISNHYDAFVLEEDGSLPNRIINEYHGLNLSAPPRLTRVSSLAEARELLAVRHFDLVLTMPFVGNLDAFALSCSIKEDYPDLPVILLAAHISQVCKPNFLFTPCGIDRCYIWSGDASLLFAIIKNLEDHANVAHDTEKAMVRVIILVEDSPSYLSSFLPLLYNAIVRQTQAVLDEGLNEEHRLLKMRARPKILIAADYEAALNLFERYQEFIFAIISDTRFPRNGQLDDEAGVALLSMARKRLGDVPLLLMSSEAVNRQRAEVIPACFIDKNHSELLRELEDFLAIHLGFGDFVFRRSDGSEVARAADFSAFEAKLREISDESLLFHAERNHFSTWIRARAEIDLASQLGKLKPVDFANLAAMRTYLVLTIHAFRKWRHLGVVSKFDRREFDPQINDFVKIGQGGMGGKARGVAFLSSLLRQRRETLAGEKDHVIAIPHTCVLASDGFEAFVEQNKLFYLCGGQDHIIAERFMAAPLPDWLQDELAAYLVKVNKPLAVRSSSMLEDARYRPYAGLYKTCMLANNHPDFKVRLAQLQRAVKMVYASAYFASPRAFSRSIGQTTLDSMPLLIQELVGCDYGGYFYPAISGVAQSHNYYPISHMQPEEGIVSVAIGFGRAVVSGECCLRFSPAYPQILPQFSTVDDTLNNVQRYLYALDLDWQRDCDLLEDDLLRLEIDDLGTGGPIAALSSTYNPVEHQIRDVAGGEHRVITFAPILKYNTYPLPEILQEMLRMGSEGMGGAVEIEFAVDLNGQGRVPIFYLLQIRPMVVGNGHGEVEISASEKNDALCLSNHALGHGVLELADIVVVKEEGFTPFQTREIARDIGRLNAELTGNGRKYLLIGPGRWGSADSLLGIPVQWNDIAGVGAMVEVLGGKMSVDPSQGTHFFQNITSLGIPYLTVNRSKAAADHLDRQWLNNQPGHDSKFLRHISLQQPLVVKVNGKVGEGIITVP